MFKRIRRLLGAASIDDQLDELEKELESIGGMVDSPEDMHDLLLLRSKVSALKDKCENSQQVMRVNDMLQRIQHLADTEQMFPSRERRASGDTDSAKPLPSEQINQIFDELKDRIENDVRAWSNDPKNEFSIPSITDRWKKESIVELFGKGGPIPRTVMGLRVRAEANSIKHDLDSMVESYRSTRLADCNEVGEKAIEYAKHDREKVVAELKRRLDVGVTHLRAFEETYDTYFRYVNLTQAVNQWFYGAIFFGGLEKLKNMLLGKIFKMAPWIRVPLLKKAADKAGKHFLEAVIAGNKQNAYNYALEHATARAFTPEGIFESKMMPPGGSFVPPLDYKAMVEKGQVFSKESWRALKAEMVFSGRFMPQTEWEKRVWPILREKYAHELQTKAEGMLGQLSLKFGGTHPTNVVTKVLDKPIHIPEDFAKAMMEDNPFDEMIGLGVVSKGVMDFDPLQLMRDFGKNGVIALRNAGTSKALERVVSPPQLAEAQDVINNQCEMDNLERKLTNYLSDRITARSDEIFSDTVKPKWDETIKDLVHRAEDTHEIVTTEDVADALRRDLDSESGKIYSKIEDICKEEMASGDWQSAISDDLSADEEIGKQWYDRCVSLYYAVFSATDITRARSMLAELIGMQGTAPVKTIGGYDLEKSLDNLIATAQSWIANLGGGG